MEGRKVIVSEGARKDLLAIEAWISLGSSSYAKSHISRILSAIRRLLQFPNLGRVVPEFGVSTIRELIHGNYRIIYEKHSDERIEVIRVLHASRKLGE